MRRLRTLEEECKERPNQKKYAHDPSLLEAYECGFEDGRKMAREWEEEEDSEDEHHIHIIRY